MTEESDMDDQADRSHDQNVGTNGDANGEESVKLVAELLSAGDALPRELERAAFHGEAASVVVGSAEGVTTFGGADADPGERTRDWLATKFKEIGTEHSEVNEPLTKLRKRA